MKNYAATFILSFIVLPLVCIAAGTPPSAGDLGTVTGYFQDYNGTNLAGVVTFTPIDFPKTNAAGGIVSGMTRSIVLTNGGLWCQLYKGIYDVYLPDRYSNITNRISLVGGDTIDLVDIVGGGSTFSNWRWVDVTASGFSVGSNPILDPPTLLSPAGTTYYGYAWFYDAADDGDKGYFSVQGWHSFARTNASNPSAYFNPHAHLMVTNLSSGTNATFVLTLRYGTVWGYLTNYYTYTNTCSFTNIYQHGIVGFGFCTNDALSGQASVIWKGRVMRVNGGDGDVGVTPVWVDSFDIHMPIDQVGTANPWSD